MLMVFHCCSSFAKVSTLAWEKSVENLMKMPSMEPKEKQTAKKLKTQATRIIFGTMCVIKKQCGVGAITITMKTVISQQTA